MRRTYLSAVFAAALAGGSAAVVAPASDATTLQPHRHVLVSGLEGALGSTIGPDGALYVVEGITGRVTRVDRRTGRRDTVTDALPKRVAPIGGAMDVAFLDQTAYVLVSLVSPDVGGTSVDGIYRVDGPHHVTVMADIGAFSLAHPPTTSFFIPTGVQFAMQPYGRGFLVTDGHHNRVLHVTLDGGITEVATYGDVVPTGLAMRGGNVYVAQAGPVPHLPENGRILRLFGSGRTVASGAPLLVDVEAGRHGKLFALSQGTFTPGHPEGSPADPGTGALEQVLPDGTMTPVATGLDQPTSVELVGDKAYVVTLSGTVVVLRGR
ncbi:MAG: ScyD/ScyE family protein [Actinomycetales bacterium]